MSVQLQNLPEKLKKDEYGFCIATRKGVRVVFDKGGIYGLLDVPLNYKLTDKRLDQLYRKNVGENFTFLKRRFEMTREMKDHITAMLQERECA